MSVANFKELLPILPKGANSAANVAYVDPGLHDRRCFYCPNDAEIVSRHGASSSTKVFAVPGACHRQQRRHCTTTLFEESQSL